MNNDMYDYAVCWEILTGLIEARHTLVFSQDESGVVIIDGDTVVAYSPETSIHRYYMKKLIK